MLECVSMFYRCLLLLLLYVVTCVCVLDSGLEIEKGECLCKCSMCEGVVCGVVWLGTVVVAAVLFVVVGCA